MSIRHFIIALSSLPIQRAHVKSGINHPTVVIACRCINIGLFLSNDLRRDVRVSLMITEGVECRVISFPGDVLKRVSPDERSISFFLLKAWETLDRLNEGTSREMDNGIYVTKQSLNEFFEDWKEFQIFRATLTDKQEIKRADNRQDGIYLYEVQEGLLDDIILNKEAIELYRPLSPERFILDINYRMDFTG